MIILLVLYDCQELFVNQINITQNDIGMAKTYLSAPKPFEKANNDWNDYVQWFKHYFLENGELKSLRNCICL